MLGTTFLLRCVTMLITSLSVPGHHLQCQNKVSYNFTVFCLVETRNYSMFSLVFIASLFRVTKENLLFETTVWPNLFLLNVFTALTHFSILFGVSDKLMFSCSCQVCENVLLLKKNFSF